MSFTSCALGGCSRFPIGLALAYAFVRRLRSGERWHDVCDPELLAHLLMVREVRRLPWPAVAMALAVALASIALAGPTWESVEQSVFRSRDARVVILDLSNSMDAPDLKPTRLVRARFKAADILARTREGQAGLVVFAGDAFVVSPLTDDSKTLIATLPALTTSIVPVQGSRADRALHRAFELLQQADVKRADVILLSDGVDDFRAVQAAGTLRESGYRVSVLAIGTAQGAPILLPDGGFLKDEAGGIVVPRLNTKGLREVARAGGGRFASLTTDNTDLDRLLGGEPGSERRPTTERTDREARAWRDEGPWLVLALLPLAAAAFRRGWLFAVVLVLWVPERTATALEWKDLWARPDQQAAAALGRGDAQTAATVAKTPHWRGVALYRSLDFGGAAELFAQTLDPTAHYNRGNALARSGLLRQALAAYDDTLELDPEHADALFNRELVAALLKQRRHEMGQSRDAGKGGSDQRSGEAGDSERPENLQPVQEGDPRGERAGPDQAAGDEGDARGSNQRPSDSQQREGGDGSNREQGRDGSGGADSDGSGPTLAGQSGFTDEQRQALEHWLRRIPDHPGGLLRQKFILDYDRRGRPAPDSARTW